MSNSLTPTMAEVIEGGVQSALESVHTSIPARVTRYDASKQQVDVQPLIKLARENEEGVRVAELLPVVRNCPVYFPGGGGFSITYPIAVGDLGLLVFSEASLDKWLSGKGAEVDPDFDLRHNLSDGIFFPGIRPFGAARPSSGTSAVVIGRDGGNAEPTVLGERLVSWLKLHTHAGSGTPPNEAATLDVPGTDPRTNDVHVTDGTGGGGGAGGGGGGGGGGGSGTVTSVGTGTGLTGGPITASGTISIANTGVTPGSYTNTTLTVNAQGQVTAISNGSGGGSGTVTSVTAGSGLTGGTITGSGTIALDPAAVVAPNGAITPGTNTKISYDAKGLVTGGVAATTADVADSTNRRYLTDAQLATLIAQLVVLAALSGTNTGDQTITLTGNVTGTGTGSFATTIANDAVTYARMQNIATAKRVLGSIAGGDPAELKASEILDFLGTPAQGQILYRNATDWVLLAPGTLGQVLVSGGIGANPSYQSISGGGGSSVAVSDAIAGATVNLTTEGTLDWYAGGTANPVNPGTSALGVAHTKLSGGHRIVDAFRWILGGISTPTPSTAASGVTYSAANVADCEAASVVNSNSRAAYSSAAANGMLNRGFGMRIPAAAATRTLKVYWSNGSGTSGVFTVTATLDDGTTASATVNFDVANPYRVTTITFAGAGQDVNITFIATTQTAAAASMGFMCATLA